VPREALGNSSGRRHHVDIGVPFVASGEGDQRAVGRKARTGLDPGMNGQAPDIRSIEVSKPQVAGIGEGDAV
jgi:hypothetical protein